MDAGEPYYKFILLHYHGIIIGPFNDLMFISPGQLNISGPSMMTFSNHRRRDRFGRHVW
jgi:hypothetical protein